MGYSVFFSPVSQVATYPREEHMQTFNQI